jgi:glycosyltransferase involved in cell wall biosynthesis
MRALLIALGSEREACSRVRVHQYVPSLRERGVEVQVESFFPPVSDGFVSRWPAIVASAATAKYVTRRTLDLARLARQADVVLLQRVLLPAPLFMLLRRAARRLVFDFDDAIDLGEDGRPRNAAQRRLTRTLQQVDTAVAASPYLAERLRTARPAMTVIPSPVDCDRYRYRDRSATPRTPESGPPVVGWIGSASTTRYLEPVVPLLRRLAAEGCCRVSLVGARLDLQTAAQVAQAAQAAQSDQAAQIAQAGFETHPWSYDTELAALAAFDVGIMPLSDDGWARGKAGYKLLQYMALGLPAVASPVGVNAEIIRDGETGTLATTSDEWERALRFQLGDAAWRREAGRAARAVVERDYSVTRWAPVFCDALLHDAPAPRPS